MQTFLPHPSFHMSARYLDKLRLNKQRIECLQILKALIDPNYGWQHHPAVKMWRNHEIALATYGHVICCEWKARGYADSCDATIRSLIAFSNFTNLAMPAWHGDPAFHSSHRACLLAKDPIWYSKFGWQETAAIRNHKGQLPYVWPV